jgi:signal transduction histidine kinase
VRIDVRVADALTVDVVNGPGSAAAESTATGGQAPHGLAGMRDRAETLGGALHAGSTDEGGFALHAELPIRSADAD